MSYRINQFTGLPDYYESGGSNFVPYSGAIAPLDLGGFNLSANDGIFAGRVQAGTPLYGYAEIGVYGSYGGYFADPTNTVYLCNGGYAIDAAGEIHTNGNLSTGSVSAESFNYLSGLGQNVQDSLNAIVSYFSGYVPLSGAASVDVTVGYSVNSNPGYTGALNDSTSTLIADVVGGIITTVYF